MISRYQALLINDFAQINVAQPAIAHHDESIHYARHQQTDGVMPELSCEHAIGSDGSAAAHDMAEHCDASFDARAIFNLFGDTFADASQSHGIG